MLFRMLWQVTSKQRGEDARWAVPILILNVSSWEEREDVGKVEETVVQNLLTLSSKNDTFTMLEVDSSLNRNLYCSMNVVQS